jgi:hypothetical protein
VVAVRAEAVFGGVGVIDPAVVAEDAQAWLPAGPSTDRLDAGDVVLRHFPHSPHFWYGSATRPRFDPAVVDRRVAEVRAWFAERSREEFMWMVGESATPPNLVGRLLDGGAELDEGDGVSLAMLLDREPPAGPPEVEVRRIRSLSDYRHWMLMSLEEASEETKTKTEAGLEAAWAEVSSDDRRYSFLALLDGKPVAGAQTVWLTCGYPYLGGATTIRAARGRGAFRALVRARWDDAVAKGVPMLIVQAGHMSAPILQSIGFRTTGTLHVLRDRSRPASL